MGLNGHFGNERLDGGDIGNDDQDRFLIVTPLDGPDTCDGARMPSVRAESVERFSGVDKHASGLDHLCGKNKRTVFRSIETDLEHE